MLAPIILTPPGWYGPSRQIISGSDTSATYRSTLIVYPTTTLASASDVVAANSTSSYRLGSVTSLRQVVSDFEPRVRKMAELVKPEDCFLWKIAHLPTLKSWVSESRRVVLIGDAAHAMVPHFGAVCFFVLLSVFDSFSACFTLEILMSIMYTNNQPGRRNSRRRRRRSRRLHRPCPLSILNPRRPQSLRETPSSKIRARPSRRSHNRAIQGYTRRSCSAGQRSKDGAEDG